MMYQPRGGDRHCALHSDALGHISDRDIPHAGAQTCLEHRVTWSLRGGGGDGGGPEHHVAEEWTAENPFRGDGRQ